MSSTNKTSHYELSQFIGTDKPAWLTDYNSDMLKIDTGLAAAAAEASGAQGTATSAASAAQAAQNTANQAVTSAQAANDDLTELKAALTNKVDSTLTRLGNANSGVATIAYNDYIQVIRFSIGWTALPNNTSVYSTYTRIPLYSIPGNIFKIAASTLTDANSKVSVTPILYSSISTSDSYKFDIVQGEYYYDGSNTILYAQFQTSIYSTFTRIINICSPSSVTLFTGNFISVDL